MRVDRTRHPLPDQVAAVPHRAWLGRSLIPAEARRACREARAHGARGEGAAAVRVDLGVVEQPQRDGIDAGRVGELVHGTLEREMPERLVGRAHRGRRIAIHMDDLVVRRDAPAGRPQRARDQRRILDVVIEDRRRRNALVADAGQLAILAGPERDRLNRCRLVADHRIHLRPRELHAHRTVQRLRGERR